MELYSLPCHQVTTIYDGAKESNNFVLKKNLPSQMFPLMQLLVVQCAAIAIMTTDQLTEYPFIRFVLAAECPDWILIGDAVTKWQGEGTSTELCLSEGFGFEFGKTCKDVIETRLYDVDDSFGHCQCDRFCSLFLDCCSENMGSFFFPEGNEEEHSLLFSDMMVSIKCTSTEFSKDDRHGLGYYMVADCPASHPLRQHCLVDLERNELTYLHYIPVETAEMVFKNIYCARCFGRDREKMAFWGLQFPSPINNTECQNVLAYVAKLFPVPLESLVMYCNWNGYAAPQNNFTFGGSRMGRLCIVPPSEDETSAIAGEDDLLILAKKLGIHEPDAFDQEEIRNLFKNDTTLMTDPSDPRFLGPGHWKRAANDSVHDQCLKILNQKPHRMNWENIKSVFFMKTKKSFKTVTFVSEICEKCDSMLLSLFASHLTSIKHFLTLDAGNTLTDGKLSIFFRDIQIRCWHLGDCLEDVNELIPSGVHIAISQTGAMVSIILLLALLNVMRSKSILRTSEARRLQALLFIYKILFFLFFGVSYALRGVACKPLAILLHVALLLSFSYSILLGIKISILMWKLKNDVASLSFDKKSQNVTVAEVVYNTAILLFCSLVGVGIFLYDSHSGEPLFGFGKNQICMTTSKKGTLYLIVIPTMVTLIIGVVSTLYSGITLYLLTKSTQSVKKTSLSKLLTFLSRMISFQSTQWTFGLVYYVTQNEVVGLLFEIFGAFEGVFIFISLMMSELLGKGVQA